VNFIYGNLKHTQDYTRDLLQLIDFYQGFLPNNHPEIDYQHQIIELEFLVADLPKMLVSMQVGAERIREIVLSLRNFSRLDEAEMKAVDIHTGIESTLMILQHRLKGKPDMPDISVIKEYETLPLVECFPGQLNQVLMNLIVNSLDALEAVTSPKEPPFIWIRTHLEEDVLAETGAIMGSETNLETQTITGVGVKAGATKISTKKILISVADNGVGIPDNIQGKIFDPFFTTKPVGKGTGLGLAIAHSTIVEKHGGKISCTSIPGHGTEFILEIPIQH
jgi:signal transduction histidine kinase